MTILTKLFCKSAGAYLPVLEKYPSQIIKYQAMGVILWITAAMASLSGGYFFSSVFSDGDKTSWLSVPFGLFWGAAIFSLDRYMIISINNTKGFWKTFAQASPRLLLAICLGILVSKPLELRFFKKEIDAKIVDLNGKDFQSKMANDTTIASINSKILDLENEKISLDAIYQAKSNEAERLKTAYLEERNGTKTNESSGKNGYGPQAKLKEKLWEEARDARSEMSIANRDQKNNIDKRIDALITQRTREESRLNQVSTGNDGPLQQIKALHSITAENIPVRIADFILSMVFILFEIAPVLVKLTVRKGLYEFAMEGLEEEKRSELNEEIKYNKYVSELAYKKKRSSLNNTTIHEQRVKNGYSEHEMEMDLATIGKANELNTQSLKNEDFVRNRFGEIKSKFKLT